MSERSASLLAPPRRTLKAPAAALARVQKVLSVVAIAPARSAVRQAHDKPVVEDLELAARRKERNERRNVLTLTLRRRWPDLFAPPFTPWAIGMHNQIVEALGCYVKDLRVVLSGWSKSPGYQKALLAEGAQRRNLDGSAAGEVTSDQQERARARLAEIKAAKSRQVLYRG